MCTHQGQINGSDEEFDRKYGAQLSAAERVAQADRAHFASALVKSNTEARLYRALFWMLLTLAGFAAILHLLQR